MEKIDFERLDEATKDYLRQASVDRGLSMAIRVAGNSGPLSHLAGLFPGIGLPIIYFVLFFPPLGSPLKESLLLTMFFFPALWFLYWTFRTTIGADTAFRSPKIVVADGANLWICHGAKVERYPIGEVVVGNIIVNNSSITLNFSTGNTARHVTVVKDEKEAGGLYSFLVWSQNLRNAGVVVKGLDAASIGRRVIVGEQLMKATLGILGQTSDQVLINPDGFKVISAPPESGVGESEAAAAGASNAFTPEIIIEAPWTIADTVGWRDPAGLLLNQKTRQFQDIKIEFQNLEADDPAFTPPPEPSVECPRKSVLPTFFLMTASAALIFYCGIHAVIFYRDGGLYEIIRENGSPPDQVRAYLLDDRNTRFRNEMENQLQFAYLTPLGKLATDAPKADPVAGPVFRKMAGALAANPVPIWTVHASGPASVEFLANFKIIISEIMRLSFGEGVFFSEPIDGMVAHIEVTLEPEADGSLKVTVALMEDPGKGLEPQARISWSSRMGDALRETAKKLAGHQLEPPK